MTRLHTAVVVGLLLTTAAPSRGQTSTWTGAASTDWNTAGNWSPSGVPNYMGSQFVASTAVFSGAGLGTVNVSNSAAVNTLDLTNPSGNYTLTTSANQTLTLAGAFGGNLFGGVTEYNAALNVATTGTDTINLANASGGSLLYSNGLNINNNSTGSGTSLVIGPNTVIGSVGITYSVDNETYPGPVIVAGTGNTVISGSFSSTNQISGGLSTYGPGTLTLSGNGTNLTGGLAIYGGNLVLDYSTNTATKLGTGALYLGGGVLTFNTNSSTAISQVIPAGTNVTGGQTDVQPNGNGVLTLNAGAISRSASGTVEFFVNGTAGTGFNVTTTTGNTNGLLGSGPAFATVSTNSGITWATVSGGLIAGFTNYGTNTYTTNTNVDVTTAAAESNVTVNSLRISTTGTLTLSGTNTLQSGGILVLGESLSAGSTITGGTLTAPGGGELIVQQYAFVGFTLNSALVSSAGLTKTGPDTLTLGGNNTGLTGPINVNRGSLYVTNLAAISSASAINFNDDRNNATQTFTVDLGNNTAATIAQPITISDGGVSLGVLASNTFSTGNSLNSRITLNQLTSLNGQATPIQFSGDPSDTSGFNLSSGGPGTTNNGLGITGTLTLVHGYLGLNNTDYPNLTFNVGNPLVLADGDATQGGVEILTNGISLNGPITISATTRLVCDGANEAYLTGTVASASSGSGFQLVKAGPGTLDYQGTGSGQLGGITLSGGTLILDYTTSTASKLGGGVLTLNGGVLSLAPNPSSSVTQTIPGGTAVAAGHTDITSSGGGSMTLALGAITRSAGATVDLSAPNGTTYTTSTGTTNGLLGSGPAFATFGGGSTWATVTSGTIAGLTTYGTNTFSSATNTDVTLPASPAAFTTNSLRFNTGNLALTLTGADTIQSGGILVTPNATGGTITGGSLSATNSTDLIVHQYSAGAFTINSALNASGGLTKTGPGTLVLGGNNGGLAGPINVNRGGLAVTNVAAVSSASAINFNDARPYSGALGSGGLQSFTVDLGVGVNGTISEPILLSAFGITDYGTYFATGASTGSTVTLSGVIGSAGGLTTSVRLTGSSLDTSGFDLTNTNTFTGNISLLHGSLGINADATLGNAANVLALEVNDPVNGGLVFLNSGVTVAHQVLINQPTRIVCNGTDSNIIAGMISGTGGITKDGTGTLTLTNPSNSITGGVTVTLGTLVVGAAGALPNGLNLTVATGGTFTPFTGASGTFGTLTLNGGTFRVPGGTGEQYFANQIVTNSAGGTVDFTGAGADQLLLTGGAGITINGNSTWLSPANGTTIVNGAGATIPIMIALGTTFTNDIALAINSTFGFRVTGGGTLFQNLDSTNVLSMTAPVTVATGSTFRVTDVSSNGGVGNLGTGTFTLDGGTFDYAGATAALVKPIAFTANGGTIEVESAATTLTVNGPITDPAGFTKTGLGTLALGSSGNTFQSLIIAGGTVQTANDNTLGTGQIIFTAAGTLQYSGTTSTARTFNVNFGTLAVAAGGTLTLNGAVVNGGFLHGPGTFVATGGAAISGATSSIDAMINQTGSASFVNFTNGGQLSIAAGLAAPSIFASVTNQGSGSITVGAASVVDVADFQTYGTLTLNPAVVGSGQFTELVNTGTSPLYFNGGSRTFLGTAATAINPATGQPADLAGINLNGQNAVVAGGLFVNNGFVADGSTSGTATIIADFGSLVKGAGFFQNSVITQNGGKFQAGNSPGSAAFGRFVFGPGGVSNYVFAIDDATGTAGPTPDALGHVSGWGLVKTIQQTAGSVATSGNFTWTATSADPLMVALDTLVNPTIVGTDVAGPMSDFDPTKAYSWLAAQWSGTYSGPTDTATLDAATSFDTSGFVNPISGTFGWSLDQADHTLSLTYTPTPVPEPGTLALVGLAAAGLAGWRRRGQRTSRARLGPA